jgi:carbamoyl-phosphate synthase large subunit
VTADFNVLLTSAGRRVSLARLFRLALDDVGVDGKVVTADFRKDAPAHFVADRSELVPRVHDENYVDRLLKLCRKHDIRLLVPLIDTELPVLAPHRERFAADGVTLLVSSPETIAICRDKFSTSEFFSQIGIPTPEIVRLPSSGRLSSEMTLSFPLLVKPADGSASVGVTKVNNHRELEFFANYVPNAIVQELVVGREYTLDVLVDFAGVVRCVVPRLRIETRAGEVSKGMTENVPTIIDAACKLVSALPGAVGCITVQCFRGDDDSLSFIEINPRFGGGFPLSAAAGANFPKWIIEWLLGRQPHVTIDGWQDWTVMLRYDAEIITTRDLVT